MPGFNILIGLSGSVAAIKIAELVNLIQTKFTENNHHINIRLIFTKKSKTFVTKADLIKLQQLSVCTLDDHEEWYLWKKVGDPVLHIELRKWADLLLIAPLSANTMAKLANGLCDNLLTCVVSDWDISKPLIFCPAMNTHMWDHPLTKRKVEELISFKYDDTPSCQAIGLWRFRMWGHGANYCYSRPGLRRVIKRGSMNRNHAENFIRKSYEIVCHRLAEHELS